MGLSAELPNPLIEPMDRETVLGMAFFPPSLTGGDEVSVAECLSLSSDRRENDKCIDRSGDWSHLPSSSSGSSSSLPYSAAAAARAEAAISTFLVCEEWK